MPPQKSKKRHLRKLYSFPVVFIIALLAITTIRGVFSSYKMHRDQEAKVSGAIEDLAALEKRENNLREENEWLKTPRGQEELFREQYMVAKEGENVMIITTNNDKNADHTVTTETKENSFLVKTKEVFGGQ